MALAIFGASLAKRIGFIYHAAGMLEDALARLGERRVALAMTHKKLHAQLVFQLANLLG
jgi:transposase InsO family protein